VTIGDIFDDVAFSMLREVRMTIESRGGKVISDFVKPIKKTNQPVDCYYSFLGVMVNNIKHETTAPLRVGITLIIPSDEVPLENRKIRGMFRRNLVRAKSKILDEYIRLENKHGYVDSTVR